MNDCTIISYPSSKDNTLLSLTESRSRYMLPFGGKYRIIDFTIRNSFYCGAKNTIIYNNFEDGLEEYVSGYDDLEEKKLSQIKVVSHEYSDIEFCKKLIQDTNTKYFIIYNGDNPSIIDFEDILYKFKKRKANSLLFRININGKPSMAYKLLVTNRNTILKTIRTIIKEKRKSPNIFEMIINILINRGIKKASFNAVYWPINNVLEYYSLNRELIRNEELFSTIYRDNIIQSQMKSEGYAQVGENAKIINSFLSDYCKIDCRVENSIIYPGVEIEKDSFIKDSIILPFVKIGSGTRITRAIIDETTDLNREENYKTIGNLCRIGTDEKNIKNSDFPQSLFSSITLIGKNAKILNDSKIGGGCYIASSLGEKHFSMKKYLYDGESIIE